MYITNSYVMCEKASVFDMILLAADIEFRLSNGEYGEVEVCWNGTWMGVSDFSVRTTRQANAICKALNHSHEGIAVI